MKHVLLLIAFMTAMVTAIAQPPADWTASMPAAKIPSGVTLADIDTLEDPIKVRFTVELDASTYDNATKSTAFNAIGTATETYILNTWLGAHAIDTADLEVVAVVIKNIDRAWDTFEHPDPIEQYIVAEDIYRVTGLVKYKVE